MHNFGYCILYPENKPSRFKLIKPIRNKHSTFQTNPGFEVNINGVWEEREKLIIIGEHDQPILIEYYAKQVTPVPKMAPVKIWFEVSEMGEDPVQKKFPVFKDMHGSFYKLRPPYRPKDEYVYFDLYRYNPETKRKKLIGEPYHLGSYYQY